MPKNKEPKSKHTVECPECGKVVSYRGFPNHAHLSHPAKVRALRDWWMKEDILVVEGVGEVFASYGDQAREVDVVNHPAHYTFGKFEVLDVLLDWFPRDPLMFSVGKYIARAKHKGSELTDLKKARFYLERKIKSLEVVERILAGVTEEKETQKK